MHDWRGVEIRPGDVIVYVTLRGHKPVLHEARVKVAESDRIQVRRDWDSQIHNTGHLSPTRQIVWLHQPENLVVIERTV
jgi:DNA polymerase elongation subunit (family B)